MKNHLTIWLIVFIALSSCKQSSDVVGKGFMQKRKYRSGMYFQKKSERFRIENESKETKGDTAIAFNEYIIEPQFETDVKPLPKRKSQKEIGIKKKQPIKKLVSSLKQNEHIADKELEFDEAGLEEIEPEITEEVINRNKRLFAWSVALMVVILIGGLGIYSLPLVLGLLPLPILLFKEVQANRSSESIFTTQLRKTLGIIALALSSILTLSLGVPLLMFIGVIAIPTLFFLFVIAAIWLFLLGLATAASLLSFKHTITGKVAAVLAGGSVASIILAALFILILLILFLLSAW